MFYTIKNNNVDQFADFEFVQDCEYTDVCTAQEWMKERGSKYIYQNNEVIINPNYEEEQIQARKQQFNKDFFNTSLGYVRRKVSMATGEVKDFLSDLLPTISMGVQMGQPVTIIAYNEPDFTQDVTDFTSLQEYKTVTAEFVQECFLQLSNDFKPLQVETEEEVNTNETVLPEPPTEEQEDDSTTNNEQS